MEDRAIALGGLVATPISIGIVAGAVCTTSACPMWRALLRGRLLPSLGPSLPTSCSCATGASRTVKSRVGPLENSSLKIVQFGSRRTF